MSDKSDKLIFKVAVFEYTTSSWIAGHRSVLQYVDRPQEEIIRISEIEEIEFIPRKKDEIVPEMVKSIQAEIDKLRTETIEKINELECKKAELLALTLQETQP